ncbi:hypothetical protein BC827DRAFT_716006 [Russula dissimulans]|nr:hypothetical protein BC827DRAFT_716006 [Russula dissimulans]
MHPSHSHVVNLTQTCYCSSGYTLEKRYFRIRSFSTCFVSLEHGTYPAAMGSPISFQSQLALFRLTVTTCSKSASWPIPSTHVSSPVILRRPVFSIALIHVTMIILLAILAATHASPVSIPSAPFISLNQRRASSCDNPDGCRSLGDIIRGCILTMILCTWVSVHPNIPSPDEKWPRIALRRLGLMLAALVVPEATRQRQVARKLHQQNIH